MVASPVASAPVISSDPFAPPCPKCKVPLAGIDEAGEGVCGGCATAWSYVLFPARRRPRPVARAVRSVEGDATCYFHAQNQAAAVCDDCGRYVCAVCEVPGEDARRLCPPCVSAIRKKTVQKADEIVTYDGMAQSLAILPILVWPFTLITAPATLCLVAYGWKKPRSLVRPRRTRFVVAAVIACLQIAAWVVFGAMAWVA